MGRSQRPTCRSACGTLLTESTVLTADIGPCPTTGTNGLIILADNITLDLSGFRLPGTSGQTGEAAGVFLFQRSGVTVKNGTIKDFAGGVAIEGGAGNTVTGITVRTCGHSGA